MDIPRKPNKDTKQHFIPSPKTQVSDVQSSAKRNGSKCVVCGHQNQKGELCNKCYYGLQDILKMSDKQLQKMDFDSKFDHLQEAHERSPKAISMILKDMLTEKDYARLWREVETPNEDIEELAMKKELSWSDVEKYAEDVGRSKDWSEFPERIKKPLRNLIVDYVGSGVINLK